MKYAIVLALSSAIAVTACKKKEFHPPDRAARVEDAESRLSPETFDTVNWGSDEARALTGNVTYSSKCATCHGSLGRGGTPYSEERRLTVPSLVQEDWSYAGDLEAVRHRIFVGHEAGMPTWGVAGISPREIDAAAFYVVEVLRPEVLGAEEGS